jgi:TonB family protein
MIKFKTMFLFHSVLLGILILNWHCSRYVSYSQSYRNTTVQPTCNTVTNDSLLHEFANDHRRSIDLIKTKLLLNDTALVNLFKSRASLFDKQDTVSFHLNLSPNGRFSRVENYSRIKLDTFTNNRFYTILNSLQFDSIPSYPLTVQFVLVVHFPEMSDPFLTLGDSFQLSQSRTSKSIVDIVMLNLNHIKNAYNWRLRKKPEISGKISVKLAVNQPGKIIYAHVVESTVKDSLLENDVVELIKRWQFCPIIQLPGIKEDITEIVYPFIFSK